MTSLIKTPQMEKFLKEIVDKGFLNTTETFTFSQNVLKTLLFYGILGSWKEKSQKQKQNKT